MLFPLVEKMLRFPGRGGKTFAAMQRLDEKLGSPHRSFASIHVAGTNGKGSVCQKLATFLQQQGFSVGLYTSPHIMSFTERISINGNPIEESAAEEHLAKIFAQVEEELSFFDLLTMLAFCYFQEQVVDWAVIEVGLGGTFDATNVIEPRLSIITTIGWDHQEILGKSLEAIALQKGGIKKRGVPLVTGPKAFPFFPNSIVAKSPTTPFYDEENREIAKKALEVLGFASPEALPIRPPCRFDVRGRYIFDVAHNEEGWLALKEALLFHFPEEQFCFIFGFSKGKPVQKCIEIFWGMGEMFCLVDFHERAETRAVLEESGLDMRFITNPREVVVKEKRVVVTGSFFLMHSFFAQSREERGSMGG